MVRILCKFRGILKSCTYRPGHGGDVTETHKALRSLSLRSLYLLEKLGDDKRSRRKSAVYPARCVFTPTIYFLNLKGKPRCAEVEQNGGKGQGIWKSVFVSFISFFRTIEPTVSLVC